MRWVARQERAVRIEEHKAAGVVGRNDSLEQLRPGSLDFRVHKGTGQEHGDVSPGRSVLWLWHCPLRTVGPPRTRARARREVSTLARSSFITPEHYQHSFMPRLATGLGYSIIAVNAPRDSQTFGGGAGAWAPSVWGRVNGRRARGDTAAGGRRRRARELPRLPRWCARLRADRKGT